MYKVTIEETTTVKKIVGNDWKIVSKKEGEASKFGYTPEIEKEVEVEQIVYTQLIENLDLNAVIKAINKMK